MSEKKIILSYLKQMVSSSEDEGDWRPPKNGTEEEDSEEEEEEEEASVKRRVPQPRKKRPAPTARNRQVRVVLSSFCAYNNVCVFSEKNNFLSHLKQSSELSSSEDEGSGDWRPPKNGTEEEDSEEEEEEEEEAIVKRRVPQPHKKPTPTPRNSPVRAPI